jgi:hypothetical protein
VDQATEEGRAHLATTNETDGLLERHLGLKIVMSQRWIFSG